ncbi:JAB domain-containing protein [uncultured Sphingomonas sp.]|mgnify:CR=1 FL=1|uniref:JAB domain-containing protein n=1 Tax=uncultured Sphingomonas sp. TaxID=158754 RepID=UPI0025EC7382|nr:JAB domain-containing protein [uncultured Sphingomonas sp.]
MATGLAPRGAGAKRIGIGAEQSCVHPAFRAVLLVYRLPCPLLHIRTRQEALSLFGALNRNDRETMGIAYLGSDRMLLGLRHVMGRPESVTVPIARIARDALLWSADSVLIAHNHPDGDARPSAADLALTRRLAQGLSALDVTLLDHLILANGAVFSLREQGLL